MQFKQQRRKYILLIQKNEENSYNCLTQVLIWLTD